MVIFNEPVVVRSGENILDVVRRKFPDAEANDIILTNADGGEFILGNLGSYISSIDRTVFYKFEVLAEICIPKGADILETVREIYPDANPAEILFQWPKTNEWRPLSSISSYTSSIERDVRIVDGEAGTASSAPSTENSQRSNRTTVAARDRGTPTASNATIVQVTSNVVNVVPSGSHGLDFYKTRINIRQNSPLPNFNDGLRYGSNSVMLNILGSPQASRTTSRLVTRKAHNKLRGRFTLIEAAMDDLNAIFSALDRDYPDLVQYVSTGGSRNVRRNRNNANVWSNHSWGTAIDIGIHGSKWYSGDSSDPTVDPQKNNLEYNGIILMAPYFRRQKWYWGGQFTNIEDGMHFEASRDRLEEWKAEGKI